MPSCTIQGDDTAAADVDADLRALQHAVNHMLYDIALAAELHRAVEPSVRACPLAA